jgi:hypothetical protein
MKIHELKSIDIIQPDYDTLDHLVKYKPPLAQMIIMQFSYPSRICGEFSPLQSIPFIVENQPPLVNPFTSNSNGVWPFLVVSPSGLLGSVTGSGNFACNFASARFFSSSASHPHI